jgi:hypothetical protein
MKKLVPLIVGVGLLVLVPYVCYPAQSRGPFRVRVFDERTGASVPHAKVTVENGVEDTTAFDGTILFWLDTALMNKTVRFTIAQRGITTTVAVPVIPGGLAALPVPAP